MSLERIYSDGYHGPLQHGSGIFDTLLPLFKTVGQEIISNPKIQESAKEVGTKAIDEIVKSIKGRAVQKGKGMKSRGRLEQILKGKGIKYLE